MIRSKAEAVQDFTPIQDQLVDAFRRAINDYLDKHILLRADYSKRTERSILHDYLVREIKKEFIDTLTGISTFHRGNLFLLGVQGRWIAKVKRLNAQKRSSSYPTPAVLAFQGQQAQAEMEGIEDPTCIEIGYQLSREGELRSATIWMVCPNGGLLEWEWHLSAEGEGEGPLPVQLPLSPAVAPPSIQPRIQPKKIATEGAVPDNKAEEKTPSA